MSKHEPDIGIGSVIKIDLHQQIIGVYFPLIEENRSYSMRENSLIRYLFSVSQKIKTLDQKEYIVEKVEFEKGLAKYICKSQIIWEYDIDCSVMTKNDSYDYLFDYGFSSSSFFNLRKSAYSVKGSYSSNLISGLINTKVDLIPHQIYVAHEVSKRSSPRVLLADEVGLGKTIEAGLIFSSLKNVGRAEKVLIIVPDSLIHQWTAEMYQQFGELFTILDENRYHQELESSSLNPFEANQRNITSFKLLTLDSTRQKQVTSVEWDLVIVDEAHHVHWDEQKPSLQWEVLQDISKHSKGLLLLTATPSLKGYGTLFGLMHLIDPSRFTDFTQFVYEMDSMKTIADCAKVIFKEGFSKKAIEELKPFFKYDEQILNILEGKESSSKSHFIEKLIDRHGTGFIYFRNRRKNIPGFPKRKLIQIPLEENNHYFESLSKLDPLAIADKTLLDFATGRRGHKFLNNAKDTVWDLGLDARKIWLENFLLGIKTQEKIVIMCSMQERVLELIEFLEDLAYKHPNPIFKKFCCFHEGQSLFDRDKQAVLFAQDNYSQVLVLSEIGGEGRNFQFAHKIILFDIPMNPEVLEQRIGRLDRIGQRHDIIIYIPWIKNTAEEVFFKWYQNALDCITKAASGCGQILDEFGEELLEAFAHFLPKHSCYSKRFTNLEHLIEASKKRSLELKKELEEGVDFLLDINSFNRSKAQNLKNQIEDLEDNPSLEFFIRSSLDYWGVDYEDFDKRGSIIIRSDSLNFLENIPGVDSEIDMILSFDRVTALKRPDVNLVTYDHKLTQGLLALALKQDRGLMSICRWNTSKAKGLYIHILVVLDANGPKHLEISKYFPCLSKEILLDQVGKDCSEFLDELNDADVTDLSKESPKFMIHLEKIKKQILAYFENMSDHLQLWSFSQKEKTLKLIEKEKYENIKRLEYLSKVNPNISQLDLEILKKKYRDIQNCINSAQIKIDAIRFVIAK